MERRISALAIISVALMQGCTTVLKHGEESTTHVTAAGSPSKMPLCKPTGAFDCPASLEGANSTSDVAMCSGAPQDCAHGAEIGIEKDAPKLEGHPLTSVVVTQCNLVVAVYMTMPDGRLVRFDRNADIPADKLVNMAYTAERSERVEVSCEGIGVAGYESHQPI